MTITLDISRAAKDWLQRQAKRSGVELPQLASGILEGAALGSTQNELWQRAITLPQARNITSKTPAQRLAALERLTASAISAPSLSDSDVSSDALYD